MISSSLPSILGGPEGVGRSVEDRIWQSIRLCLRRYVFADNNPTTRLVLPPTLPQSAIRLTAPSKREPTHIESLKNLTLVGRLFSIFYLYFTNLPPAWQGFPARSWRRFPALARTSGGFLWGGRGLGGLGGRRGDRKSTRLNSSH